LLAPSEQFQDGPFSTSQVPASESFALWSRVLSKWLLNVHGNALGDGRFHAAVRLRVLPEMRFGWGVVGASSYSRTRDVTDNDDLFLFMNLGGTFVASGKGHEIELAPGEGYVMNCSEIGAHASVTDGRVLTLRVPNAAMRPLVRDLNGKTGNIIRRDHEGLNMLSTYLRSVGETEPLSDQATRRLATRHVQELFALALGATDDAREAAEDGGLPAARLRAAKAIIRRNLSQPKLSAEYIAGCLNISPRSLQRLFETDGTTFSVFVAGERVAQAHAALSDPRKFGLSVADIALDCGFGDISYFNRRFKSRYGASPSEVRFEARSLVRRP